MFKVNFEHISHLVLVGTDVDNSLIPLKKEQIWETLKAIANIRKHDFGNSVFEEGHQLPTIFYH